MKAFIVHIVLLNIFPAYVYARHVRALYHTRLRTLRFPQFRENIFVSRKNRIYNSNKIQLRE